MSPPVYIALEGPEGCGKSTQAKRLADAIGAVLTRETGGTPIGERLRTILHDVTVTELDARAESLIVAADRAQHVAEIVRPALDAGRHVVSDRTVYSSLAYQGYGRELPIEELRSINDWANPRHVARSRGAARCPDQGDRQPHEVAPPRPVRTCRSPISMPGSPAGSRRWPPPIPTTGPSSTPVVRSPRSRNDIRGRRAGTVGDLMASIWDAVVGQPRAVERLTRAAIQPVHAYLFVGPSGSTKKQAARAFAALLIGGVDDPDARDARLALAGMHPDIREIERAGPAISAEQAREIVRLSSLAPIESDRKVLILAEFHLLRPEGAALLLEDDRGTSAVDDLHRPRRLRTCRSRDDLVEVRADRVPLDRRRSDRRTTRRRGG